MQKNYNKTEMLGIIGGRELTEPEKEKRIDEIMDKIPIRYFRFNS